MATLTLTLLGPFQAWVGDQPANSFESNKVRALLAFLAVEASRPHPRESLAGLLWPDWPDRAALSNLRYALSNLREVIGDRQAQPPFLLISRDRIQFNIASDYQLDVTTFSSLAEEAKTAPALLERLERAAACYQGDFLSGFSIGDSAPFEEWALLKREGFHRQMIDMLFRLIAAYEQRNDYEQSQQFARRLVEMEPWNEEAHQRLMLALALAGQRSTALAQYEACRRALDIELGVAPSQETTALYDRIRDGTLDKPLIPAVKESPAPGNPPYKGLQPFDEHDADIYFGREELIERLAARILPSSPYPQERRSGEHFLAVVGASGSGKSSLLRAGLIPAVKERQPSADTAGSIPNWQVHFITPTNFPLEALVDSLAAASIPAADRAVRIDDLRCDPRSLYLFVRKRLNHAASSRSNPESGVIEHEGKFLLVVDQFEELFTLCQDETDRGAFIDNLMYMAGVFEAGSNREEENGRIYVVIALRADFYAHCAAYPDLRRVISRCQEYIGPMTSEGLRRAIKRPAHAGGWVLEPGLVDLLLHDVGAGEGQTPEPGALPLLSHALLETWKRRRGRMLTLSGYAETGGVRRAITQTAEEIFESLPGERQAIARRIFLQLTEIGEGTATRRRANLAEINLSSQDSPEQYQAIEAVLKQLADSRLITMSENMVEVSHEALVREWPRLRQWLEESQESLRLNRQIVEAAQEWERLEYDPGALYRGARLAQALERRAESDYSLGPLVDSFLDASQTSAENEAIEREEQQRRELLAARQLADAEKQRAQEQALAVKQLRRRAKILAGAFLLAGFLAAAALFLGWQARTNARRAELEARVARSHELAAEAVLNLETDPELGIWLAMQAVSASKTLEAENSLHRAIQASRALLTIPLSGEAWCVRFNPDGTRLATGDSEGNLQIWDSANGKELLALAGHPAGINSLAFSPDGRLLATAGDDGSVKIWDVMSGQELQSFFEKERLWLSVTFSPEGGRLAASNELGVVMLWEVATWKQMLKINAHPGWMGGVTFSPDGMKLATAGEEGVAKVWEASTGRELLTLAGHTNGISTVVFSPDGTRLATAGYDTTARLWDAATGQQLLSLSGHTALVRAASFTPDGNQLITAGQDGAAKVWNFEIDSSLHTATGKEYLTLTGHAGAIEGMAVSQDGRLLATAGRDATVKVWNITLSGSRELLTVPGMEVVFNSDGEHLTTLNLLDDKKLAQLQVFSLSPDGGKTPVSQTSIAVPAPITAGTMKPGNVPQAFVSEDLVVYVLDAAGREKAHFSVSSHASQVDSLDLSPDGRIVAVNNLDDGTATLWEAATGKYLRTLSGHNGPVWAISFSPDGSRIATGSVDSTVRIWEVRTGQEILTLSGHQSIVTSVVFDAQGERLATTSWDGTAKVWDARTGQELRTLKGHAATVIKAAFNQEGTQLATGSYDGTARVWDLNSGLELLSLTGHSGWVNSVAFSSDGTRLATGSAQDGTVRVYLLNIEELLSIARSRLTRPIRPEECLKYLQRQACD